MAEVNIENSIVLLTKFGKDKVIETMMCSDIGTAECVTIWLCKHKIVTMIPSTVEHQHVVMVNVFTIRVNFTSKITILSHKLEIDNFIIIYIIINNFIIMRVTKGNYLSI